MHDGTEYQRIDHDGDWSEFDVIHLAGTYDGKTMQLFVNGRKVGEGVDLGDRFQPSSLPIMIGANPQPGPETPGMRPGIKPGELVFGGGFNGVLDEVRLSNVVRYKSDFKPTVRCQPDENTMALYHFDEGAGTLAVDSSGNGHHGQIWGPQWTDEFSEKKTTDTREPWHESVDRFSFVDIRSRVNWRHNESIPAGRDDDFRELPQGVNDFNAVKFAVCEGSVQLGSKIGRSFPKRVNGIRIDRTFEKLHVLHATRWSIGEKFFVADGTVVGQIEFVYEDDQVETVPIVYGEDVRDWWNVGPPKATTRGKVAWQGANPAVKAFNTERFDSITRFGPTQRPEGKVVRLNYASADTTAGPFCVAMTTEHASSEEAGASLNQPPADMPRLDDPLTEAGLAAMRQTEERHGETELTWEEAMGSLR